MILHFGNIKRSGCSLQAGAAAVLVACRIDMTSRKIQKQENAASTTWSLATDASLLTIQ